ncbi:MAG: hypothetical protein WD688_25505 [Candidatus Binatia bacterium]
MSGTAKILETGPVLKLLGGKKNYEKFVLDGTGESHNEEYYEVEDQRFLCFAHGKFSFEWNLPVSFLQAGLLCGAANHQEGKNRDF